MFLPQLAEAIDPSAIRFLDPETFTDIPEGARRVADVLAEVQARDDDAPDLVLIHTEVQAKEGADFAYHMWEYNALLTLRRRRPVISIALLPFAGGESVRLVRYSETLFGQEYARLDYWRIPLRGLIAEEYLAADSPLAAAMAALMRPRSGDRVELRLAILERLVDAELDEARQFLLVNLVETYLELDDMERAAYEARVTEEGRQAVATVEMTWADRIRQEGLAQGREEAKREMLLELIQTRFGTAPVESLP